VTCFINTRSHFSLGESLLTPTEITEEALKCGATSVVLCDTMRITGMVELVEACKKNKIKPIIGARLRIVDTLTFDKDSKKTNKPYYLRVIVKTEAGYRAVLTLLSRAFDAEHFYEVPRLLLSDVAEVMGGAGVDASIVTLGDFYGAAVASKALDVVSTLKDSNVSVASEIMPIPIPHFARVAHEAFELQASHGVPVIISQPFFYKESSQAESLDLLRCIALNHSFEWSTKHYWRNFVPLDKSQSVQQMINFAEFMERLYGLSKAEWWAKLATGWKFTQDVPSSVTYIWEKQEPSLPVMAPDEFAELVNQCKTGFEIRLKMSVLGYQPSDLKPYVERLKYELSVIRKLKFESYFLLVSEIVTWSKKEGVRVGPARGSVGGSLIAFLIGITDIDPIRFNLLFERFINPDRIDLPDADLDFMSTRREDVITFIKARFGDEYVAAVSNYNTMGAAGALKDTCAKLEFKGNTFAFGKLVPKEHGISLSLEEAITTVPELVKFAAENPGIILHARNLEDRMRNYGKHAAGIVVAGVPVSERAVVERRNGDAIVNWDKTLVESFGLVKMDILGLSNLDMVDIAIKHIKRMHGKHIDTLDIPLDDPKVLEAFSKGETVGIFQFESIGMRRLLRDMAQLGTLTFEDITAATALYRPGPMDSGLMAQFVRIKQGSLAPSYPHPSMEDALKDTYGVMVYQEEVMQVSRDFAGFTLIEADHLRKAIGSKQKDKMATYRQKFIDGAVAKHGVLDAFAAEIFDQIEKFAGYGFNKSHAAAYSIISYQTMWLKVNYPVEFFCGLLSCVKNDRRMAIISDMQRLEINVLPPDINDSSLIFEPLNMNSALMPFNAIKGIGDIPSNAILKAREAGRFTSIADFESKVVKGKCNVAHRDKLNRVGAFSRIESEQLPATDHTRRRDQVELLEGLITESVIIDREGLTLDVYTVPRLTAIINDYKACNLCELTGLCHPKPGINGPSRVMVVIDGPNFKEEGRDEMGYGSYMESLEQALENAGLESRDIYITSLIKSPKPETTKKWSNKTLSECPVWLDREIELLKPPVVVLLGTLSFKHFCPDLNGSMNDHVGRVVFDKARDCNILVGFNPGQIFHDSSKQETLNDVFGKIADLLPE
jgi:DNA polymerase-3 subunit alpha